MKKRTSQAFGKDVYLIGELYNEYCWLEHPSWDCGWYWGFGYIEVYTSHKSPNRSRDISLHSHWNSKNTMKHFTNTVLTTEEYDKVDALFKQFYSAKEKAAAEKGILDSQFKYLNTILIPEIMLEIIHIVSGDKSITIRLPEID